MRLALTLALLAFPLGASALDDDALFKACPALRAWAAAHPRSSSEASEAPGTTIAKPALRAELARRADADQKAREVFETSTMPDPKSMDAMSSVDRENLKWLKRVVAKTGLPTVEQVGIDGVGNAFLLVQHADSDPDFQEAMLAVLEQRLASGGVRKSEFAMLTDRVLSARGKPQRYGTQFERKENGAFVQKPTEDPEHLDERRRQMDLMPMSTYECVLRASYASP
jgi:hypothetical protein